jgi:hypothetical protein
MRDADPETKNRHVVFLLKIISQISADITRDGYLAELHQCTGISKNVLAEQLKKVIAVNTKTENPKPKAALNGHENSKFKTQNPELEENPATGPFWFTGTDRKTKEAKVIVMDDQLLSWLETGQGFYQMPVHEESKMEYQFVQIQERIIEPVSDKYIKGHTYNWLREQKATDVFNIIRRSASAFMGPEKLYSLPIRSALPIRRDTPDSCFLNFKNCVLEITRDKIIQRQYSEFDNYIYRKTTIPHSFEPDGDYAGLDFNIFMQRAITGKENMETDADATKYGSYMSAYGYMIHRYKRIDKAKAIVSVDKESRQDTTEKKGRTGKNLTLQAIEQMVPVFAIDGKNFRWDNQFNFDGVDKETALIAFNDVRDDFKFENLFNLITEGIRINPKGMKPYMLRFNDSPKFYINTNGIIKEDSDSALDRMHIMEFSNYYNLNRKPYDEFKRLFFADYEEKDYIQFYNLMAACVQLYLNEGLIPFPLENYYTRTVLEKVPSAARDFFEDQDFQLGITYIKKGEPENNDIFDSDKKPLYETYLATYEKNNKRPPGTEMFSRWLKIYIEKEKGWVINKGHAGGRHRKKNIEFVTFSER